MGRAARSTSSFESSERSNSAVSRTRLESCCTQRFDRYPELDLLRPLPAGTLVDGELVAFDAEGRPDLPRLLRRHGLTDPWRIRQARHWCPVRYVLFDLLYHAGHCLVRERLARRREVLAEVCHRLDAADVRFSEGVVGAGTAL